MTVSEMKRVSVLAKSSEICDFTSGDGLPSRLIRNHKISVESEERNDAESRYDQHDAIEYNKQHVCHI